MMFLKENGGKIFKTFGFSMVLSIFGFMLFMATIKNPALLVVGFAVMLCCYLYLMYEPMWQLGGNDKLSPTAKGFSAKGLVIMIVAFLPAAVLTLLCIIIPPTAITIGEVTDYNWTYALFQIIRLLFHGIYVGIVQYLLPFSSDAGNISNLALQPIFLLISLIPGILAGALGYFLGYREKTLRGIFGIKVTPNKNT